MFLPFGQFHRASGDAQHRQICPRWPCDMCCMRVRVEVFHNAAYFYPDLQAISNALSWWAKLAHNTPVLQCVFRPGFRTLGPQLHPSEYNPCQGWDSGGGGATRHTNTCTVVTTNRVSHNGVKGVTSWIHFHKPNATACSEDVSIHLGVSQSLRSEWCMSKLVCNYVVLSWPCVQLYTVSAGAIQGMACIMRSKIWGISGEVSALEMKK